jgi:hypothetical protein
VTPTDVSVTKAKLADEVDIFAGTSLSAADLGAGIHIKTADSGASVDSSADELVLEGSGNAGMTIASGATSNGIIYFADSGSTYDGYINYNQNDREMTLGTAQTAALKIDANGHVTMPKQTAVQVRPASTQSNVSDGDTVAFGTERFDINGDFASNTFTAPVTGKYLVNFVTRTQQLDTASSHVRYRFNTSNITYEIIKSPDVYTADQTFSLWNFNLLCDFDANDTMTVTIDFSGGADQIDIDDQTFLSINLAC